ncbi:hypothetical protein [Butyrivibrio fibrisolvens]|nr:hypothetical protein [Butyrivibrio fibrisolvens]
MFIILLIIAIIWLFVGHILMWTLGRKLAPSGGLDSIANALFYVMVWRSLVWGPPIILTLVGLFSWLYNSHIGMIKYVILAIVFVLILRKLYGTVGRQILMTPLKNAASIQKYDAWLEDRKERASYYSVAARTEYDYICEYIAKKVVDTTVLNIAHIYPKTYQKKRVEYVNAALQEATKTIPHVTGYEYIMDITSIIPKRTNAPAYGYLLSNAELLAISEHYGKRLNTEHFGDRYQFSKNASNNFHSNYPMVAIFYDDGTMDLEVTAPVIKY